MPHLNSMRVPPLALYIHFPWCIRKCPYCDFNSHEIKAEIDEHAYVDTLLSDLEQDLPLVWGRRISSVFMGGGTPSLFSASSIERLMAGLRALLPILPQAEITMEVNPSSAEQHRFVGYREAGVNRLSIGVQSFQQSQLTRLGRVHDAEQAMRAADMARQAGFDNFNFDLMFGLPSQEIKQAEDDINIAVSMSPTHISHYQLTLEPNTEFARNPPQLPDDELIWQMQQSCQMLLHKSGFHQYEISAYARPKFEAKHNVNYWRFGDYLGIGAGAHAKITDINRCIITRFSKHKHPKRYLQGKQQLNFISSRRQLSSQDLGIEYMMNALRLREGVDIEDFSAFTGYSLDMLGDALQQAREKKLLVDNSSRLKATPLGQRYLNELLQLFVPDDYHSGL